MMEQKFQLGSLWFKYYFYYLPMKKKPSIFFHSIDIQKEGQQSCLYCYHPQIVTLLRL